MAFIGPGNAALGLKALGFETRACDGACDAAGHLKDLAGNKDLAVIFIASHIAAEMEAEEFSGLKATVIPLPVSRGDFGPLRENMSRLTREAIGRRIK